jgi:hypothetical protein
MSKSGCRIDDGKKVLFRLHYFGHFQQSIQSQTLYIRSVEDLQDIRDHIDEKLQEIENDKKENI